jgi:hypothetical protein
LTLKKNWREKMSPLFSFGHSSAESYYLMRRLFATGLGLLYLNAFAIYYHQGLGLFGAQGLLPYQDLFGSSQSAGLGSLENFKTFLSYFAFDSSDFAITFVGVAGMLLSLPVIFGWVNFPILFLLWFLHLSVVHAGQIFYSFGWETQLLELTFLSFFLFPFWNPKLNRPESPPKMIAIWFMRWMMFRLMLGAGLIKIRGDQCWRELTCTQFHYETQPNPHPLSWLFHHLPDWFHRLEVVGNHFIELVLPFALFGPKAIRRICGVLMILFQTSLILSGNLAWLNWLTILMAFPCFDDEFLHRILRFAKLKPYQKIQAKPLGTMTRVTLLLFFFSGTALSLEPALNLVSERQVMNASYNRLHLINSYGAFGSIGKERFEIVISGTSDSKISEKTQWQEYEFKCKPGRVDRRPCLITPYHYRVDWQIWFSAMRPNLNELWLLRLGIGLLESNQHVLALLDHSPFGNQAPQFIKMDLYRYEFSVAGSSDWWRRTFIGPYSEPLNLQHPLVIKYQ